MKTALSALAAMAIIVGGMGIAPAAAPALEQAPDAALRTDLQAKDQALLDAIAPGRREVWDQALAPGALYIDENGAVMDRATYLSSLAPLPEGATGRLVIMDYRLRRFGNTALVVHRDAEQENYHGIALQAHYS